ncbi:MAG: YifB family Mg chelatase-like AAA ATPase [Lachnospiraceae bacterium]|nr:YifB family Mg chelatase-like AAA ATPase [Lachnospiraceae bacterium]
MYSKTYCASVQGIEGRIIQIEADISDGLPNFSLVGYLSSEVKEARERVRIALKNAGYRFPPRKVTINLSPADIRKDGTGYDLAIAVAILTAYGYIPEDRMDTILFIGELSLEGKIKPVPGVLPMVYTGWEQGMRYCFVPDENREEAAVVDGISVYGVSSLRQAVELLLKDDLDSCVRKKTKREGKKIVKIPDFADVQGQELVRRAAEVAASGMHNMMMIGPPGSGKSMIARRFAGILPDMTFQEQMELSRIYSVSGLLSKERPLVDDRPFRAPHHTITQTALVGGGRYPRPGEISLASGGVLFLDELPEFDRNAIEVLRQPLEEGWVNLSRLNGNCRYPARCLLLAAMNPCKCGWYPDKSRCRCTPQQVRSYLGKISQPLLDRIDICTETIPLKYQELEDERIASESSEEIRQRVEEAQKIQLERYQGEEFFHNAQLTPQKIKKYCPMKKDAREYLQMIFEKMEFSARAYHKILKVGRSIADLAGSEMIERKHIAEAVCYRLIDRKYWGRGGEE